LTIIYRDIYFPAIATIINDKIIICISNNLKGTAKEQLILSRVNRDCEKARKEQICFINIEEMPPEP
jgi:hypothetical protein